MNRYYNLKETSTKTGVSRASIYKFYKKYPNLKSETTIRNRKRLIPENHLTRIAKTHVYTKSIELTKEVEQLKRLVDLLKESESIQYKMYQIEWDLFGTIAFKNDSNKKYSYYQMSKVFEHLIDLYGKEMELKVFFTIEPFSNRGGSHIHFVMKVDQRITCEKLIKDFKDYFRKDRVEIKPYSRYQAGVYYISKSGLEGDDWDIFIN